MFGSPLLEISQNAKLSTLSVIYQASGHRGFCTRERNSQQIDFVENGRRTYAFRQALLLHQSQNCGVAGHLASHNASSVANVSVHLQVQRPVDAELGDLHQLGNIHAAGLESLDLKYVALLEVAETASRVAGASGDAERRNRLHSRVARSDTFKNETMVWENVHRQPCKRSGRFQGLCLSAPSKCAW